MRQYWVFLSKNRENDKISLFFSTSTSCRKIRSDRKTFPSLSLRTVFCHVECDMKNITFVIFLCRLACINRHTRSRMHLLRWSYLSSRTLLSRHRVVHYTVGRRCSLTNTSRCFFGTRALDYTPVDYLGLAALRSPTRRLSSQARLETSIR